MEREKKIKEVQRRANNRIAKKFPLFAEQFAIDYKEAEKKVEAEEERKERFVKNLEESDREAERVAEMYRCVINDFFPADVIDKYYKTYNNRSEYRADRYCNILARNMRLKSYEVYNLLET